jgi:hypothetical protein
MIGLVPDLEQAQRTVESELSTWTQKDVVNLVVVAGISLFGVWVMTLRVRDDDEEPEDDEPDVCALCARVIDPRKGAVFPGPQSQAALGLYPGEAVCKRCERQIVASR